MHEAAAGSEMTTMAAARRSQRTPSARSCRAPGYRQVSPLLSLFVLHTLFVALKSRNDRTYTDAEESIARDA